MMNDLYEAYFHFRDHAWSVVSRSGRVARDEYGVEMLWNNAADASDYANRLNAAEVVA